MFRIECFCDDRKVGDVLRALAGLVHGNPVVQPVANAKVANGKVVAKGAGDIVSTFTDWAKKSKAQDLNVRDIRTYCREVGRREEAANYVLKILQEHGVLRKHGKGTKSAYRVVTSGA